MFQCDLARFKITHKTIIRAMGAQWVNLPQLTLADMPKKSFLTIYHKISVSFPSLVPFLSSKVLKLPLHVQGASISIFLWKKIVDD